MTTCIEKRAAEELNVSVQDGRFTVKIPKVLSRTHYLSALEQLLRLTEENAPAAWEIDLSEFKRVPIALASVLLGFGEQARKMGCKVSFTGVRNAVFRSLPCQQAWVRCFGVPAAPGEVAVHENECELTLQPF